MPEFSRLRHPPLSKYWDQEEAFSEWLAAENNIHHLRETLGLDVLVAEELELEVKGYYVDILARDKLHDVDVVVENQFTRSDHDHWGKAHTYSANLEADVIVWIAPEFTDAHLKAVREHNRTSDRFVFALRAEIIEIEGCDQVAFRLETEEEPSEWPYTDSPIGMYQTQFWQQLVTLAGEQGHEKLTRGNVPEHYSEENTQAYHLPVAEDIKTDCGVTLRATTDNLSVELQINEDDEHALFDTLNRHQQEIDTELREQTGENAEIIWERGQGIKRDKIRIDYTSGDFDIHSLEKYEKYHEWLLSSATAMRSTFADRIHQIERQ